MLQNRADLSHVIHSAAQIRSDSYRASGALALTEKWLLGAAVPTQSDFKRGQVLGGEAHLGIVVVLPSSVTALTPLGLFFCFSLLPSNHLEWINIFFIKGTISLSYKDLTCVIVVIQPSEVFMICVGAAVDLM